MISHYGSRPRTVTSWLMSKLLHAEGILSPCSCNTAGLVVAVIMLAAILYLCLPGV